MKKSPVPLQQKETADEAELLRKNDGLSNNGHAETNKVLTKSRFLLYLYSLTVSAVFYVGVLQLVDWT